MVVRVSEGRHLEILEASPAAGVPLEFDVYDGENPASFLAALHNVREGMVQDVLSDCGSGSFIIPRDDPKAVHVVRGNYVKVKLGNVDRSAFWIEDPLTVLTAAGEAVDEVITGKGRGALAYIERAAVYPPVWPPQPAAVGATTSADNGAGAVSVTGGKPTGTIAGSALLAVVTFAGGSGKTLSTPLGWKLIERRDHGTALGVALFRRTASSGDGATYKWTFTSSTAASVIIARLANVSLDPTQYAVSIETGAGTAITNPSVSVGLVDGVLLTFSGTTANTSIAPAAGMTEHQDRGAAGRTVELASLAGPALGDTGDKVATAALTGSWIGMTVLVPSSGSNDAVFTSETFGGILSTLIDRAVARGTIPYLTYDFTSSADSNGEPWDSEHDLTFHVGTSLLDVWRHLTSLGLEGGMTPALKLRAFVDQSRHFEDDVILRKGKHLRGRVTESGRRSSLRSRFLVEGAGGRVIEVSDTALETDLRVRRIEGYLALRTSDDPTELQRAGDAALAAARLDDEARTVPVEHGTLEGEYEPYVDYRLGDWIGLDAAGTGEATGVRVAAMTLAQKDTPDYSVELDLTSVALDTLVRLRKAIERIAGGGTSVSGGSGYALGAGTTGGGGGGGGSAGTVAAQAGDSPGFLFDKLTTDDTIRKSLVDAGGSKRVKLAVDGTGVQLKAEKGVADGYAPLSSGVLVPVAYLGSGGADASKFLRGDGTWAVVPGSSAVLDAKPALFTPPAVPNAKDDEFDDAGGMSGPVNGLNARWSKRNLGTAAWLRLDDAYAPGALGFDIPTGQAADQWIYQAVPVGNFVAYARLNAIQHSDRHMWSLAILDTNGTGIGLRLDTGGATQLMNITTWVQTATVVATTLNLQTLLNTGSPINAWIEYAGGTAPATVRGAMTGGERGKFALQGVVTQTRNFTPAYIAFGRSFGTGIGRLALDAIRIV